MKILLVMESVPGAQKHERKEDLFTMAARSFAKVAIHADLFVLSPLPGGSHEAIEHAYSVDAVIPHRRRFGILPVKQKAANLGTIAKTSIAPFYTGQSRPDLVVALQSIDQTGMLAHEVQRVIGSPYMVWEHKTSCQRGRLSERKRATYREVIEASDKTLAVSAPLASTLVERLGVPPEKIGVHPNALSNAFFDLPEEDVLPPGTTEFLRRHFVFGGWTNWRDIKNPDLALDAFARLRDQYPDIGLVMAGPVPEPVRARAEADDRILFTGPVDRRGVHALAHGVDCCILPSQHETFGLPLIEAFAAGNPAVTTVSGGPESLIPDAGFGEVVESMDAEAFAEGMRKVYENSRNNRYDGDAIAAYCKAWYSEDAYIERTKRLLGLA